MSEHELIQDLKTIVSFNSVSVKGDNEAPFGTGVKDALKATLDICEKYGFETEMCGNYCGYAQIGKGDKLIGILTHLDVVPPGKGWNTDPFDLSEGEGKLFGRGVIDDKGPTIAAIHAVKELLEEKYGKEEAKERIFVTTDRQKGALKDLANKEGYETFVVPDDIGGRFSVISAVGLLPLCVAGIDIDKFVAGFKKGIENYTVDSFEENKAIQYAALRNMLNEDGKDLEVLVNYEPKLKYVSEWWKQLFAESEGKDGKGIFPVSVNNTTDLHSVGQMIQEGKRNLFETVLKVQNANKDLTIMEDEENLDGLNYLAGKKMSFVNEKAMEGTIIAHVKGNVPNILLTIDDVSAESLGELFYFFEIVVGVSGYMLGVNPFNQPGVEEYKSQMFKLLGKPGY